jgi:hypothetical protein
MRTDNKTTEQQDKTMAMGAAAVQNMHQTLQEIHTYRRQYKIYF